MPLYPKYSIWMHLLSEKLDFKSFLQKLWATLGMWSEVRMGWLFTLASGTISHWIIRYLRLVELKRYLYVFGLEIIWNWRDLKAPEQHGCCPQWYISDHQKRLTPWTWTHQPGEGSPNLLLDILFISAPCLLHGVAAPTQPFQRLTAEPMGYPFDGN